MPILRTTALAARTDLLRPQLSRASRALTRSGTGHTPRDQHRLHSSSRLSKKKRSTANDPVMPPHLNVTVVRPPSH